MWLLALELLCLPSQETAAADTQAADTLDGAEDPG